MEQAQKVRKKSKKIRTKRSEGVCQYALSGLAGMILGGGLFQGQGLPLGVCLIAAQSPGGRALGAATGAIAGYFLRCDPGEAVEYTAVSLLVLMALYLFQGTALQGRGWFMPLCCGMICLVMGGIRVMSATEAHVAWWIGRGLLAALGTQIFRKAMGGHRRSRVVFGGLLVFSLATVGKYVDLGLWAAMTVSCVTGELLPGAVMGVKKKC